MSLGKSLASEVDEEEKKSERLRTLSQSVDDKNTSSKIAEAVIEESPAKYERMLDSMKSEKKSTQIDEDFSAVDAKE